MALWTRRPRVLTTPRLGLLLAIALLAPLAIFAIASRPAPSKPRHVTAAAAGPIGTGWQKYDLITSPGDWNQSANGAPDIIARNASDGTLWLFTGDGRGGYKGPTHIASGWGIYTIVLGPADFRGHRLPNDLMAVRNDGYLILFPNLGHGVFGQAVSLGPGWGGFDSVLAAGDFDGDGTPDIIVRNAADGLLTLYRGNGHGGFSGHSLISSVSFSGYSLLAAPGDWDNDGYPDLVGRSADGTLCLFRGNGRGGLQNTSCIPIGTGWGAFDTIVTPGMWDQDNQVDMLARTPNGSLWLATGGGISGYTDPMSLTQCSTINLYISSQAPRYSINFERFGPADPQSVATMSQSNGQIQAITANAAREGANWQQSAAFSDTCSWSSGLYAAQLATTAPIGATGAWVSYTAYVTFVVRPLSPPATRQLLVVASTNTWAAYNDWPQGGSFYSPGRPTQVSYLRPDPAASPLFEGSHLAGGEMQVLRWLTAHNFSYQVVTDVDLNDSPSTLSTANYYAVLLNTHSEYWTDPMYNALARYLQNGGSVLSLSGNTMYRKENLTKPSQGAHWSSLLQGGVHPIRNAYAVGNLLGLTFHETIDTCAPYQVLQPTSWLMAGVSTRTIGPDGKTWPTGCYLNSPGVGAGASGWEIDLRLPFLLNRHYQIVAAGTNPEMGADLAWYMRRDGGQTVNVGSISFGNSLSIDANLSRIVVNALTNFQQFTDAGQTSFGGLIAPGDWDGDGYPDLFARRGDNLYMFKGNGLGGWMGSRLAGRGWAQFNLIAPAGSWMRHLRPDLFARKASNGALFAAPNNGSGGFGRFIQIGPTVNWSSYDTITGVGDWNGDGIPDLIARTPAGSLYLFRGTGNGQVDPTPQLLATGWDSFDQIIAPVDWNGDGLPDLIARKPDGTMWIALGRADHTLVTPVQMPHTDGWDQYSTIVGGGAWSSGSHQDLLARKADGTVWVVIGTGATEFSGSFQTAAGWNEFS
ncbi:MAG: VCBS repeat-containing protein [Candidatus Dormibacteraeota bacterium]|nr:VCBS repeat-containing protein [Candidatus Dormibacteraeota bacterium]